ncbi:MAG: hypothetical protein AB7T49_20995 [Oligoflexales bacterium]
MKKYRVNVYIALALVCGIATFAACKQRGEPRGSNTLSSEDQVFAQNAQWKCGTVKALRDSIESWANTTQCKPSTLASMFSSQEYTVIVCCAR